jgi:hypothetical protein
MILRVDVPSRQLMLHATMQRTDMAINWIWIVGLLAPLGAPALLRMTMLLIEQRRQSRHPQLIFASQDEVERLAETLREFMPRVLNLRFEDCLITDESSLADFEPERLTSESLRRIEQIYGIHDADLLDHKLVNICGEIERRRLGLGGST